MIRIATFPIKDFEKANEFMREHPTILTGEADKGAGINILNDFIIVTYEDGVVDYNREKKRHLDNALISKTENVIKLEMDIALSEFELVRIFPNDDGYKSFLEISDSERIVHFKENMGLSHKDATTMVQTVSGILQKKILAEKEVARIKTFVIPTLEKLLEEI